MEQATLAGHHGGEDVGRNGGANFGDRFGCKFADLAVASGFEVVGVEGDAIVLFLFETEDLGRDVLDGMEEFAVAVDEKGSVRAAEFDYDLGPRSPIGRGAIDVSLEVEAGSELK